MDDKEFLAQRCTDVKELSLSFDIIPRGIDLVCGTANLVLHTLISYQDWQYDSQGRVKYTGTCSLSNQNIADLLEVHINTVKRALTSLKDMNVVRVIRVGTQYKKFLDFSEMEAMQLEWDKRASKIGINRRISKKALTKNDLEDTQIDLKLNLQSTENDPKMVIQETEIAPHYNYIKPLNNIFKTLSNEFEGSKNLIEDFGDKEDTPSKPHSPISSLEEIAGNQSELDLIGNEFGVPASERIILSERELKKLKGIDRLLAGGETKPIDIVTYFNKKFSQVYNRTLTNKFYTSPQSLAILQKGFMDLYPRDKWISIIDTLIEDYEKIPSLKGSLTKYPTPTITTLTQNWIINIVLDWITQKDQRQEQKEIDNKQKAYEEGLKQLPQMSSQFYYHILDVLGEDVFKIFDEKYKEGKLNHVTWLDNFDYPIDQIRGDILNG